MSFRKTQISLLLIALASCFMMTAQAASLCNMCLYDQDANTHSDPSKGACLMIPLSGNAGGFDLSTPFVGHCSGFTVDSFRYIGLQGCDLCMFTAYSSAGESAVIDGNVGYNSLDFSAESLEVWCDSDSHMEEEEAEEWVETRL